MQTALHSESTSHQGPSLVPLAPGTGAAPPGTISRSAEPYSSSLGGTGEPGTHTGHLASKGNPFASPAWKAAAPQNRPTVTESQGSWMQPGASSTRDWRKLGSCAQAATPMSSLPRAIPGTGALSAQARLKAELVHGGMEQLHYK